MSKPLIELSLWQQLDTVARLGTLSAAAKELGLSQPALTKSMRRLEARLGATLFTRSRTTRIVLNDTGRLAAKGARELLESHDSLISAIRRSASEDQSIRVAYSDPAYGAALLPLIQRRFPDTPIYLLPMSDELMVTSLLSEDISMGLTGRHRDIPGVTFKRLVLTQQNTHCYVMSREGSAYTLP